MDTTSLPARRLRWRPTALALLILGLVLWLSVPLIEVPTLVNLAVHTKGALVLSVFGGGEPEPLDSSGFPTGIRQRLETYLARRSAFRTRLPEPPLRTTEHETWTARVAVEREIVALINAPGIENLAAAYASRARIAAPWDDASDGPLAEARDVEDYLNADPATPLRPYLWLFLMHRCKAALPRMNAEGANDADIGAVTMKYARGRALAAGAADPLIGLIAADIDTVASVNPLVRRSAR